MDLENDVAVSECNTESHSQADTAASHMNSHTITQQDSENGPLTGRSAADSKTHGNSVAGSAPQSPANAVGNVSISTVYERKQSGSDSSPVKPLNLTGLVGAGGSENKSPAFTQPHPPQSQAQSSAAAPFASPVRLLTPEPQSNRSSKSSVTAQSVAREVEMKR